MILNFVGFFNAICLIINDEIIHWFDTYKSYCWHIQQSLQYNIKITQKSIKYCLHRKALYIKVTPRFAQINGFFINKKDQVEAEGKLMLSHQNIHVFSLKELSHSHIQLEQKLLDGLSEVRFLKYWKNDYLIVYIVKDFSPLKWKTKI